MIWGMHKRIAGFVSLLALAASAASRPALAQEADGEWFDDSGQPADSAPPPEQPQGDPQVPAYGPQGQPIPSEGATTEPVGNLPETDPRALTEFRPTLDPYGTWVDDQKYGTVWVPNRDAVGDDFAPYVTSGRWALTDDNDWSWQSDYPFGDVVFHYGRWVWVPGEGWAWVAGRRYANAWVNWRVPTDDYGYIGWAPMPPAWGWYGGSAVSLWWNPPAPYVFCPSGYAFSYNVHSYIVHDQYVIRDVAAHTRNYAGNGHLAASPRVLPANSTPMRGPSLQSVHIPAGSANRLSGGFAAGSRGSSSLRSNPYSRSDSTYGSGSARSYANSSNFVRPSSSRPVNTTPYTYSRPSNYSGYRAAPQRSYYSGAQSSPRPYSAPSYSAPSTAYRAAPARSYSAPSYSAPSTSAPARSYSAPSTSFHSAPARSYSTPSFHSSSSHVRR